MFLPSNAIPEMYSAAGESMEHSFEGSAYDKKPVFDWNKVPVGMVTNAERDPKTRGAKRLTLELTPEARASLGTNELVIDLPMHLVFGMRRDGVTLDRSLTELKKIDFFASVLKK